LSTYMVVKVQTCLRTSRRFAVRFGFAAQVISVPSRSRPGLTPICRTRFRHSFPRL